MARKKSERNGQLEESDERFKRIEAILLDHTRILMVHGRILEALAEAVREKIGIKLPQTQSTAQS